MRPADSWLLMQEIKIPERRTALRGYLSEVDLQIPAGFGVGALSLGLFSGLSFAFAWTLQGKTGPGGKGSDNGADKTQRRKGPPRATKPTNREAFPYLALHRGGDHLYSLSAYARWVLNTRPCVGAMITRCSLGASFVRVETFSLGHASEITEPVGQPSVTPTRGFWCKAVADLKTRAESFCRYRNSRPQGHRNVNTVHIPILFATFPEHLREKIAETRAGRHLRHSVRETREQRHLRRTVLQAAAIAHSAWTCPKHWKQFALCRILTSVGKVRIDSSRSL